MDNATQALDSVEVVSNSEGQAGYAVGKHPWRRYFARGIDSLVNPFFLYLWIGVALAVFLPSTGQAFFTWMESVNFFVDIIMSLAIATLINVVLLATLGTTLGKFIFGVRIRETDGRALSLKRAFRRELLVWFRGLALGMPVVTLLTQARAYNKLDNDGVTSWDNDMNLVVTHRPQTILQIVLWIAIAVALVAVRVSLIMMSGLVGS